MIVLLFWVGCFVDGNWLLCDFGLGCGSLLRGFNGMPLWWMMFVVDFCLGLIDVGYLVYLVDLCISGTLFCLLLFCVGFGDFGG